MPTMPSKTYKVKSIGKKTKYDKPKNWLKDQSHKWIYDSQRWRKLRKSYLQRNPVCVMCDRGAKYLDHILPISQGGDIWDEDNLQGLCTSCNARKTSLQKKK